MLTRAVAGIHHGKPVFCLPGSPGAARLGLEIILGEIGHILKHIGE
jgi:molybdenum cofactor biosynthesis protein B